MKRINLWFTAAAGGFAAWLLWPVPGATPVPHRPSPLSSHRLAMVERAKARNLEVARAADSGLAAPVESRAERKAVPVPVVEGEGFGAVSNAAVEAAMPVVRRPNDRGHPRLPLAFREVPEDTVWLEPSQAEAAEAVQDQFVEDVGGEEVDPAEPGYRERWRQARSLSDQRLRARIGGQAFAAWQREAHARAVEAGKK